MLKLDFQVSFMHKTAFIWLNLKILLRNEDYHMHFNGNSGPQNQSAALKSTYRQSSRFCCGDQAACGSARADSAQASAAGLERLCHRHTPRVKVFLDARRADAVLT